MTGENKDSPVTAFLKSSNIFLDKPGPESALSVGSATHSAPRFEVISTQWLTLPPQLEVELHAEDK